MTGDCSPAGFLIGLGDQTVRFSLRVWRVLKLLLGCPNRSKRTDLRGVQRMISVTVGCSDMTRSRGVKMIVGCTKYRFLVVSGLTAWTMVDSFWVLGIDYCT